MDNRNFQSNNDDNKSKSRIFWKHVGFIGIALCLAVITVFVLYLNV